MNAECQRWATANQITIFLDTFECCRICDGPFCEGSSRKCGFCKFENYKPLRKPEEIGPHGQRFVALGKFQLGFCSNMRLGSTLNSPIFRVYFCARRHRTADCIPLAEADMLTESLVTLRTSFSLRCAFGQCRNMVTRFQGSASHPTNCAPKGSMALRVCKATKKEFRCRRPRSLL